MEESRGWFVRVLTNLARQRQRAEGRRLTREAQSARSERQEDSTGEAVERFELHWKLVKAVDDLDQPYRMTILLRYFEAVPAAEIAERTDVPVSTMNSRLRRALDLDQAMAERPLEARQGK